MKKFMLIAVSLVLVPFLAMADMKEDINKTILKAVNKISPGVKPDIISPSPIDGIYEVVISSKLVYISADGKYLFDGKLFDITKREDLSAPIEAKVRKKAIDKVVNGGGLITYKPEKTKYVATVFTDIDCGYCRKLHSHIDEYNSLGIEVRYMFMPRAGINSNSYKKAVSAVCADNPQKALTDLKSGKTIPSKNCENHIAEQFELARQIGIRGTPGIVTESGRVLPGYMPPQRLLFELQRDVVEGK